MGDFKIVVVKDGKEIKKLRLNGSQKLQIVIGRTPDQCDLAIVEHFISRKHSKITTSGTGQLFIEDLNSTNGTFVNSQQIPAGKLVQIKEGDVITFAKQFFSVQILVFEYGKASNQQVHVPQTHKTINSGSHGNLFKNKKRILIGRTAENDLVFDENFVSRHHAYIEQEGNSYFITDTSTNGTYVNGRLISSRTRLSNSDEIKIGSRIFNLGTILSSSNGKVKSEKSITDNINLAELLTQKSKVFIGRSAECELVLNDKKISRKHAVLENVGGKYFLTDLNSVNGTFVNGKQITKRTEIKTSDEILIGFFALSIDGKAKNISNEVAIRAVNIQKSYVPGKIALHTMSVDIPHKSFVALMGPSGCGKSTLLKALNGNNPATKGQVFVHGFELEKNYNFIKHKIGYVPQDDIVHRDLTILESLYYAAKLRLPQNTSKDEIDERINEVLTSLKLNDKELVKQKISDLSGGQRKRVSIAVELLSKPTILFLDEPTSPLDPETIDEFLNTIRSLTDQDMTVVMVTHKPEDLKYVDRVIFMAAKGYHVYYGDKDNILSYFSTENIIRVYSKFNGENIDEIKNWYKKYYTDSSTEGLVTNKSNIKSAIPNSFINQLFWLSSRYLKIKFSDMKNMGLILFQPIIIAVLIIFIFKNLQIGVLFMMTVSAIWFGVNNAAKEIVDEKEIYKRERMVNLRITTYLLSKLIVLSVFALTQVVLFVLLVYVGYMNDVVSLVYPLKHIAFMFYLSFSATLMGLLISTIFDNTEKVMTFVPLVLIPQLVLAGIIAPIDNQLKEGLSYVTLSRWGTEGMSWIQNDYPNYKVEINDSLMIKIDEDTIEIPVCGDNGMCVMKDTIVPKYDTVENTSTNLCQYQSIAVTVPRTYMHEINDTMIFEDGSDEAKPYVENLGNKISYSDPIENLGFYEDNLMGLFKGLTANYLVITFINLITILALFVLMKRKDSI